MAFPRAAALDSPTMQRLALGLALVALLSGCGAQLTILKPLDAANAERLTTATTIKIYDTANFPPPDGKPSPQVAHLIRALARKGYHVVRLTPEQAPRPQGAYDKALVKAHRQEWLAADEILLVVNF